MMKRWLALKAAVESPQTNKTHENILSRVLKNLPFAS